MWRGTLKSNASSQSFKKRVKDLEKLSTRIEAKMERLEKIIAGMSKSLS
jgi:glutaredoxin 2